MSQLRRTVGLRTVISTGAGLALASISYVSLVEMSDFVSGSAGWMALAVAGVICYLASLCFAELGGMYPSAAGIKLFIEKAFGENAALVLAGLYITATLSIVGAETYILGQVLSYGFPGVPVTVWVLAFLLGVALLNIRGVKQTGLFQDFVSYFMFASLLAISLAALVKYDFPLDAPLQPFRDKSGGDFFQAVGLAVFLYLGFEWVTPLAEEVSEYKSIPRGMAWSIILLFVTYACLGTAMTAIGGKAELSQAVAAGKPIPHVLFAIKAFGPAALMFMMLMSLVASLTSFNAGLLTASRFLYALSRDHAAPKFLSRIHERYMTPHCAIWLLFAVCAVISVTVIASGAIKPFIYMGAFAECLIYVVMAASVIQLRRKVPDHPRPFRVRTLAIPILVTVFFSALGIGLLADNHVAAIAMLGGLAAMLAYVKLVVPRYRAQAAAAAAARTPRRRRPGTAEGSSAPAGVATGNLAGDGIGPGTQRSGLPDEPG